MTEKLDLDQLLQATATSPLVRRVVFVHETTSTQDVIRAAATAGEPGGLLVVTDHQTAGRGQFGRSWHDIPGDTLLCSLLLRPEQLLPGQTPGIVLAFAQTLVDILQSAGPRAPIQVKLPNDVVVDSPTGPRKLAGILAEGVVNPSGQQWVALGFGMNINRKPTTLVDGKNLDHTSAAINEVVSHPFTRTSLLVAIIKQLAISN